MNIDHLREFVYLAETLSFSITADNFFISKSVLSKHIASLEKELGARLFDRTSAGVSLTDAGRVFYQDIEVAINDVDRAIDDVHTVASCSKSVLRIGYLRYAAHPFFTAFIDYLGEHYPELRVEAVRLEYGALIKAHWSHKVDVILQMNFDPAARPVCDMEPIYRDKLYLIVPKDNSLACKTEGVMPQDMIGERFTLPRESSYPGFAGFVRGLVREVPGASYEEYSDIDTMFAGIRDRGYIGFCSKNILEYQEGIAWVPVLYADTSYDVCAMWLKSMNAQLVTATRAASEFCRKYMSHQKL